MKNKLNKLGSLVMSSGCIGALTGMILVLVASMLADSPTETTDDIEKEEE